MQSHRDFKKRLEDRWRDGQTTALPGKRRGRAGPTTLRNAGEPRAAVRQIAGGSSCSADIVSLTLVVIFRSASWETQIHLHPTSSRSSFFSLPLPNDAKGNIYEQQTRSFCPPLHMRGTYLTNLFFFSLFFWHVHTWPAATSGRSGCSSPHPPSFLRVSDFRPVLWLILIYRPCRSPWKERHPFLSPPEIFFSCSSSLFVCRW